jgi:crotonobetainyl-CoA:carnitine CoA-transferase CaiB-like acyl-CoA transferase
MLDATMATDDQLHYDLEDSEHTGPLPSATWETGAGPILISADFRYLWKLLVEFFDMADPSTPDMALTQKIAVRRAAINTFLAGLEDWQAVEDAMNRMNLAWGQVRTAASLTSQPTVQARGSTATHYPVALSILRRDQRRTRARPAPG